MQNRILPLIVVVVVAIIIGVALAVQRTTQSVVVQQLSGIATTLQNIEQRLSKEPSGGSDDLYARLSDIERRLSSMETQQRTLVSDISNLKAAPAQPRVVQQQPPSEDLNKVYDIPLAHSPVRGNEKASVTIVEFTDFQCPFCARFHPPIKEVLQTYPKQVKYVLKNFPLSFHPQAKPAAKAALAAGEQGKFYEMADLLLENGTALSEAKFEELAQQLGLNVERFKKDYKDKDAQWEKIIQDDIALGGQVDVRGTPTFYLNGRKTNARDLNGWKAEIDKIIQEKK